MACCPHGVVYGIKFLLRGESPRDHVDILLSLKFQPTVVISDIPSFIARHGNKRKQDMFWPNDGRFVEANKSNIDKFEAGTLKVSIPELDFGRILHEPICDDHAYSKQPDHPITQLRNTYSAYDRFHEENTSSTIEKLRRLDIVNECSAINSQVVEEFFSQIKRSNHFLTQLSPIRHIFLVRLLCHLHNTSVNQKHLQVIRKTFPETDYSLVASDDGRMIVTNTDHGNYFYNFVIKRQKMEPLIYKNFYYTLNYRHQAHLCNIY